MIIDGVLDYAAVDLLDVDGRPCGEIASRRYPDVATEVIACPYADARRGTPMNLSALRQLTAVWPALVASVRAQAGPNATVSRAFRTVIAGTTGPLAFRAQHGDEPIPRALAALFKVGLGFSQVLSTLLLADDGVADAPLAELGDSDAFFAWLDRDRWLLGQVQACGGSAPMIAEMFDALCGRAGDAVLAPEVAAIGEAHVDPAVAAIGVQVAYLAALSRVVRGGGSIEGARGAPWLDRPPAPWLRAVASVPNRPPEHARRLFALGALPAPVARMLAAADHGHAAIEVAFQAEIAALRART